MTPADDRAARSERARRYHERTKHQPQRFAAGPGRLDWANQPEPFRVFAGAPRVELPLAAGDVPTAYRALFEPGAAPPRAPDLAALGAFLQLALGLTAWKEYQGARWALRADPSSGNLHPTEAYVLAPELPGLAAGVHHYLSRDHCLERRWRPRAEDAEAWSRALPAGGLLVGLSSVHWREAWKYGERAFRYCQHDAGHVLATLRYAAAALGWSARLLEGPADGALAALLGLDRDADHPGVHALEREHPEALVWVGPPGARPTPREGPAAAAELSALLAGGEWTGRAAPLSPAHVDWGAIADVAEATLRPAAGARGGEDEGEGEGEDGPPRAEALPPHATSSDEGIAALAQRRRSAVALDEQTSMPAARFFELLDALLARPDAPPFDALPWAPRVHLALFVHRVDGLAPGVLWLERTAEVHERLVAALGEPGERVRHPDLPGHLRLFRLHEGDTRRVAAAVSCGQDIAGDGAFSLGMLAELRAHVERDPHAYRELFWEAGAVGQALYLEAEAAGLRGTGIGCYFDDAVHSTLGLRGDAFQSLYHFTVGGPVEDERLRTHPPYAGLRREA